MEFLNSFLRHTDIGALTAMASWPWIPNSLRSRSKNRRQSEIAAPESELDRLGSAEAQLARMHQGLAVSLGHIGTGFIATDCDGRVSGMNAVAEQVTGWLQAEALQQPLGTVFHREGRSTAQASGDPAELMIGQGLAGDTLDRVVVVSRQGDRTRVELKADLTQATDGSVLGLTIVFRDLAPRLRAEAESSRIAAIVESSGDAI
ncbi:MAG: PAS domain-containing protein, partial [Burkholderiaceae bacterium]|nr:PAS domain-containing protein [Burkholderiaceae bacterium]